VRRRGGPGGAIVYERAVAGTDAPAVRPDRRADTCDHSSSIIRRRPSRRSTVPAAGVAETITSPAEAPPNPLRVAAPKTTLATAVAAMVAITIL
jgi:hypothetical protein